MTTGPGISRTPLPKGFKAGGVNSGVRRYRPDYGVILSEPEAVGVGVFTKNECKAAPIQYCMGLLPSKHVRAIVTNSGQANAATGQEGRDKNWRMALSVSKQIGCLPHQVLTASTGVIGKQLEIEYTMTDPEYWEGEWRSTKRFNRVDDVDIEEVSCLPDLNEHLQSTTSKAQVR